MGYSNYPANTDDVIDSRHVEEAIDELEQLKNDAQETGDWDEFTGEEEDLLEALIELRKEAEGTPDWIYGVPLIRESYWKDYAQSTAEEMGLINTDATWPNSCIDWDKAADELLQDYFEAEFDGVTYYVRS